MLHCRTQPIIESSTNLGFCCWRADYANLAGQMDKAGLSIFHNFWSAVYNFSPKQQSSWRFVDESSFHFGKGGILKHHLPQEVQVRCSVFDL